MNREKLINYGVAILVFLLTLMIFFLIMGKLGEKWDKEVTKCERLGGVVVNYECFESILSVFKCNLVETGIFCTFPDGNKYKLVYDGRN
jgi:hypothetical protein